ncbi:MAG TPA: S8 family serine peptidase, partial [Candidatus Deferrimicrobiaceae bacterium]|nr:S8 family serine peptidase [Candidatus Deferrimicrobiaceae bacterium]
MSRLKQIANVFFVIWGVASLSGVEVLPDRAKIEPLALVAEGRGVPAAEEKVVGTSEGSSAGLPVFFRLRFGDGDFPQKVEALGGRTKRVHPQVYTGEIPGDAIRYVSNWPEVAYIEAAKRVYPLLDLSRPAVFADDVQSGAGLPAPYTGAGTYVGIVDSGLSDSHLDFFYNGDPSQPRVSYWYRGQSYSGVDTEWHGTHIAGIAAGNGFRSGGLFTGMAPGARLLVAKTTFTTVDIVQRVSDLLSFAGATPAAINLSLALNVGPHDGTSGFESGIGFLATDGVAPDRRQIIAVAAGNERTDGEHFQTVLPPFGSVNIPLTLEDGGLESLVDLWADGADRYTVTATLGTESASAATGGSASSSTGRVEIF